MGAIDHIPQGNPCNRCGESAFKHRVEHKPDGDPCETCGLPASRHRVRTRKQGSKEEAIYVGIDGEGQGRDIHRYVLIGASTETGDRQWWISNDSGLSTVECLDFILELPKNHVKVFSYSFNYDLTKILQDIPDEILYLLFRPELRARTGKDAVKGPRAVRWNGYKLNLQGTKFSVAKGDRYRVIWDIFKFFQGKFTSALTDWKVGDKELIERMTHMKDKRADFDKESKEGVRVYCLEECRCMAELARKLVDAHDKVDLTLKSFYGAGSSASAMLLNMGVKSKIHKPPKDLNIPIASAFFGGRFENSVIGKIEGTVYSYDISSAYPYQLCFLPCLIHGTWEHVTDRKALENCRTAVIRYSLQSNPRIISEHTSWGPFPYRTDDGAICYPIASAGGWLWKDEYLAGERLYPHVKFEEAWVYHCDCDCRPFERIPDYYSERCRIGKEGPGIVLKLGCNSCYGKLAQSVGRGIFNSWVWAGLITSGCRAQILDFLGMHKDRANMLMVATDGIYTRERFHVDAPDKRYPLIGNETRVKPARETGTAHTGKPLGGWEEKVITKGVFVARPGIYFPIGPTKEEIKDVRGRGVGKGVVLENWQKIMDSWEQHGLKEPASVANVSRFCGAKSSISRSGKPGKYTYKRANGKCEHGFTNGRECHTCDERDIPHYGNWITRSVKLGFHPMPKRAGVNPDNRTLTLRRIKGDDLSMPYVKAIKSQDSKVLDYVNQELLEQPDADLADYELETAT